MNNKSLFIRYREKIEEINNLDYSIYYRIGTGLLSFIMALIVVLGPVTILINAYIFYDLIPLVFLGLSLCLYVLIFLTRVFYFQGITKKECGSLKDIYIVEALLALGITIACFIFVLF